MGLTKSPITYQPQPAALTPEFGTVPHFDTNIGVNVVPIPHFDKNIATKMAMFSHFANYSQNSDQLNTYPDNTLQHTEVTMNVSDMIKNEIEGVALQLVNEVIDQVDFLYGALVDMPEAKKDGIREEISMEWDRLQFHNVKLHIPSMPTEGLAGIVGALAKELWKEEVNGLLDKYDSQEPDYLAPFRL